MKLSNTLAQDLFSLSPIQTSAFEKTYSFVQEFFQRIANNAKPKGQRSNIGPTHPLRGELAYQKLVKVTALAELKQFPFDEKLPDGRHRYFLKDGEYIDRLK